MPLLRYFVIFSKRRYHNGYKAYNSWCLFSKTSSNITLQGKTATIIKFLLFNILRITWLLSFPTSSELHQTPPQIWTWPITIGHTRIIDWSICLLVVFYTPQASEHEKHKRQIDSDRGRILKQTKKRNVMQRWNKQGLVGAAWRLSKASKSIHDLSTCTSCIDIGLLRQCLLLYMLR